MFSCQDFTATIAITFSLRHGESQGTAWPCVLRRGLGFQGLLLTGQ